MLLLVTSMVQYEEILQIESTEIYSYVLELNMRNSAINIVFESIAYSNAENAFLHAIYLNA